MKIWKRILKLFISLVYWFIQTGNRGLRRLFGVSNKAVWVVLYYHSVGEEQKERFARQMDVLKKIAKPVSIEEKNIPDDSTYLVSITFDDGFRSVRVNALPVLNERNIPCTIFIPTGYMGQHPSWHMSEDDPDRQETVMTPDELREIENDMVIIGSHTVSHPRLSQMDRENAMKEMDQSKKELEEILHHPVTWISFPHGDYDDKILSMAKQIGYTRVFSINPFLYDSQNDFCIGRCKADPNDWMLEFRLKAVGAYAWEAMLKRIRMKIKSMLL